MSFAPVIPEEKAAEVFDVNSANTCACRFMNHVQRAARLARAHPGRGLCGRLGATTNNARDTNPLYHNIVSAFGLEMGIPVLVNTSFNVHEEPIVNTPGECAKALVNKRIDFMVTHRAIYKAAVQQQMNETGGGFQPLAPPNRLYRRPTGG